MRSRVWELGYDPAELLPAPLPTWVLGLATAANGRRLRSDATPRVFREGERNDGLTRIAGAIRRYGIGEAALRGCLAVINRHHAQPPLGDAEVAKIAASVSRYAPGTSSEKSGEASRHTVAVLVE